MYSQRRMKVPFHVALETIIKRIQENGFLLLHEINTKEILQRSGIEIKELRQLLFFHPTYMKTLLEVDASKVIRVPLKIVVREIEKDETEITASIPSMIFEDTPALIAWSLDLDERVNKIVG